MLTEFHTTYLQERQLVARSEATSAAAEAAAKKASEEHKPSIKLKMDFSNFAAVKKE